MKRALAFVAAVSIFTAANAYALDASAENAQELFDEAKQLVMQGKWSEACPKLARSQQLDPRPTTLFRLAECYEHTGKSATARSTYLAAASGAAAAGESKRAEYAQQRAKRLEAVTPYLVIAVNQRPATVYRDGERIDETQWGIRIAVDPGEHAVSAESPGKQPFAAKVFIADAATTVVTIPPLLDMPTGAAPAPPSAERSSSARAPGGGPTPPSPPDNTTLRRWGLGVLGFGVVAAGVGGGLALTATDTGDGCEGVCATGTGLMIGGAIFAATGFALFLASFGDPEPRHSSSAPPFLFRF